MTSVSLIAPIQIQGQSITDEARVRQLQTQQVQVGIEI